MVPVRVAVDHDGRRVRASPGEGGHVVGMGQGVPDEAMPGALEEDAADPEVPGVDFMDDRVGVHAVLYGFSSRQGRGGGHDG
jgi:hypothetical protein